MRWKTILMMLCPLFLLVTLLSFGSAVTAESRVACPHCQTRTPHPTHPCCTPPPTGPGYTPTPHPTHPCCTPPPTEPGYTPTPHPTHPCCTPPPTETQPPPPPTETPPPTPTPFPTETPPPPTPTETPLPPTSLEVEIAIEQVVRDGDTVTVVGTISAQNDVENPAYINWVRYGLEYQAGAWLALTDWIPFQEGEIAGPRVIEPGGLAVWPYAVSFQVIPDARTYRITGYVELENHPEGPHIFLDRALFTIEAPALGRN